MDSGEKYTVRQYLQAEEGYDHNTIEWLETFNYGTRWYDQGLSEMILEDLDFNHQKPWWCVEGGSQEVAHRMRQNIEANKHRISFHKKVETMSLTDDKKAIKMNVKGETTVRQYDAVFNSVPLGSMQRIDLSGLNLNWGTKQAIRSLGYGASCKVGIRFKTLWWIEHLGMSEGGVAKTDLPLRVCVYPSYSRHDTGKPGILLCSYTWSQEAQRLATLINRESPKDEEELKSILIRDLSKLHSKTNDPKDYERSYSTISEAYEMHYAYDWYADPGTTGAFAYFDPGQFRNMYPWITRNSAKHIIVGEAASAHHAWVVGALDSAVRGVYQFLYRHSKHNKAAHEAVQMYNNGKVESPFGPLPAEYDRQADVDLIDAEGNVLDQIKASDTGEWAREQVIFEKIRLEQGGDQLVPQDVREEQILPLVKAATPT